MIIGFNTFLPAGYEINQSDIEQSEAAYRLSRQRELQQQQAVEQAAAEPQAAESEPQSVPTTQSPQTTSPDAINPGTSGPLAADSSSTTTTTITQQPGRQFEEAISLIKKIKTRYAHEPNSATFKEFLDVLNNFRNVQGASQDPVQQDQVYAKVSRLLRDDQDLLEEFRYILIERKIRAYAS